jgi:hypothetical protein
MPILETERQSMPRSALRHRPLHPSQAGPAPVIARRSRPDAVASAAKVAPDDLGVEEEERSPRRSAPAPHQSIAPTTHTKRRFHPVFWLGVGALSLLLLWVGMSQLVTWGSQKLDDLRYGSPRITQMDGILGNGDSTGNPSHLLALNLRGEIIVEVFPSADASRMKAYILTTLSGPGSDRDVVKLRLIDPAHTGKPDIVVQVGESASVLVNDGQGGFRSPTPAEQQQLLPYLQS